MIGEYAEIRLHASKTLPPPQTADTVQYSKLNVALLSATSTTSPLHACFLCREITTIEWRSGAISRNRCTPSGLVVFCVFSHRAPSQTFILLKHLITLGALTYVIQSLIILCRQDDQWPLDSAATGTSAALLEEVWQCCWFR